jgi:hypothetical protein
VHGACAVTAWKTITPWMVCRRATYGRAAFAGVKSDRPLYRSYGTALTKPQDGAAGSPAPALRAWTESLACRVS